MKTYFFDYTVNNAYLCEEYNGYQPADGKCILVAEVTVKNTFNESIEMYDTDFQIQWNSDGADDYDYPITAYADPVSDDQLEETYELGINEETTGLLVYEVLWEKMISLFHILKCLTTIPKVMYTSYILRRRCSKNGMRFCSRKRWGRRLLAVL